MYYIMVINGPSLGDTCIEMRLKWNTSNILEPQASNYDARNVLWINTTPWKLKVVFHWKVAI